MDAETSFNHEIDNNPKPEDAGTIKIYASIVGIIDPVLTCPTFPVLYRSLEFVKDIDGGSNQVLNAFLIDAGIVTDVLLDLYMHVDEIVHFSPEYSPGCALSVRMTIDPSPPQIEEEEAVQVSFDETNIGFRPASKLAVMSLNKKFYNKATSMCDDSCCTICLEAFGAAGERVVTLPCGYVFDDQCIVDWFRTSHVCPLCRFKLPIEGEN